MDALSSSSTQTLTTLPRDVLKLIDLNLVDLRILRVVSKFWCEFAEERMLHLTIVYQWGIETLCLGSRLLDKLLGKYGADLRRISMINFKNKEIVFNRLNCCTKLEALGLSNPFFVDSDIERVSNIPGMIAIKSLQVPFISLKLAGMLFITKTFTNLTSLAISDYHNEFGSGGLTVITTSFKNLSSLSIEFNLNKIWTCVSEIFQPLGTSLTSLRLKRANLKDEEITKIVTVLPFLKTFGCPDNHITEESALTIVHTLPELTELDISDNGIKDGGLTVIAQTLTSLRSLNATQVAGIESDRDSVLKLICTTLTRLNHLRFDFNYFTDEGADLISNLPLVDLYLYGSLISAKTLRKIADITTLRALDLKGNPVISAEDIQKNAPRLTSLTTFLSPNTIMHHEALMAIAYSMSSLTYLSLYVKTMPFDDLQTIVHKLPYLRNLEINAESEPSINDRELDTLTETFFREKGCKVEFYRRHLTDD